MNEWNLIHLGKGGLHDMKLSGGGGEHYMKPENDVPYHVPYHIFPNSNFNFSALHCFNNNEIDELICIAATS